MSMRTISRIAVLGAAAAGLLASPPVMAQARVLPPDAAIGSFYTAPQPPPPAPVYGPMATTGTAVPGVPSTGIDPRTYLGTGTSPPLPSQGDIAESVPTDTNAAIGRPKGRIPQATAQSGRTVVIEEASPRSKLADCMAMWDPGTHMTRDDWRRTCRKSLAGSETGYTRTRRRR